MHRSHGSSSADKERAVACIFTGESGHNCSGALTGLREGILRLASGSRDEG